MSLNVVQNGVRICRLRRTASSDTAKQQRSTIVGCSHHLLSSAHLSSTRLVRGGRTPLKVSSYFTVVYYILLTKNGRSSSQAEAATNHLPLAEVLGGFHRYDTLEREDKPPRPSSPRIGM